MAVNWTSTGNLQIFSQSFSSQVTGHRQQPLIHSLLAMTSDPATKGSAKDLEVHKNDKNFNNESSYGFKMAEQDGGSFNYRSPSESH